MRLSDRSDLGRMRAAFVALGLGVAITLGQASPVVARGAPESFADLAEQVSDAVVNITTQTSVSAAADRSTPMLPEGSPFEDFFRDFMDRNGPGGDGPQQRQRRGAALGSGFVISDDGYIVTNNHVIEGADEITIEFFSGYELPAEVIGTDPNTDIALLKVESDQPLPFVPFGDSEVARVGDWVMAMGNPLGQGFSVSAGIVSARGRALSGSYDDYIQTDAAINRGNSGGPLFNMEGEVIGVNTAILSPNGGSIGIGFAMSSAVVTPVVDQLKQFGETRRGWLGVRIQNVTDELADALGLESPEGALVTDVPEGPASAAGMRSGDVILSFDGNEVADTRGLVRNVGNTSVGKTVPVTVFRDGAIETLDVTLGRRETAEAVPASAPANEPIQSELLGMEVTGLSDELRAQLDLADDTTGLVVTDIDEESAAFDKGLRRGDLITEAGQEKVASAADLSTAVDAAREGGRKSLLLLIERAGEPRFVALPIDEE
ncbi:DegQ family serine endoprotease [Rhodobacteraceae bacterium SC52]|nr:DegQ family serine endoprotease [Rhodobacteraceae bacterium SC52]